MMFRNLCPGFSGSAKAACGVFTLSSALLGASLWTDNALSAVQEEPAQEAVAAPVDATTGLKVPSDINEESLEKIDEAFAAAASPLLRTLFNADETAAVRRQAAAELNAALGNLSTEKAGAAAMKNRLARRVSLVAASVEAGEVSNVTASPGGSLSAVNTAAAETSAWLNNVVNGDLWKAYLHLDELGGPAPTPQTLQQVARNLQINDAVNEQQKAFMERPQLQQLRTAVDSAIAAAAYEGDETSTRVEMKRQINHFVATLLAYENNRLSPDADSARHTYRTLRSQFPAAAEVLHPEVLYHYFNHNLHFTISEHLLSRLVADYRTDSGCIADCILGAWVTGSQVTGVNVSADIRPSANSAHFQIVASGNTQSNTTAQKDPATVYTRGNHFFHIGKPVYFDGRQVTSGPGNINVSINNTTVGVRTKYDGIPIVGGIIRNIARGEVAKSAPQSRAIAAQRLSSEALPKFEDEAQTQFAELNDTLSKTLQSLDNKGVGPESISARSSNTHIAVSSRTMGPARLGGSTQPEALLSPQGLIVQLHESAMNNTLDALELNGRAIHEDELINEIENSLSELLQRDIKFGKKSDAAGTPDAPAEPPAPEADPEPPTTFVFAQSDPIRVHFDDDKLIVVLRTGVRQEGKEEIPEQIISIPINLSVAEGKLIVDPGMAGVSSKEDTNRVRQVTRANQIRRILDRKIIRRELDATFDLQGAGDKLLPVTLTMIYVNDGWLTAEIQ